MYNKTYKKTVRPNNLFVFDIETIPDASAAYNLTNCTSTDVDDQRKSLKTYHLKNTNDANDFLRQPFHRVVAISYASFEIIYDDVNNFEKYKLKHLKSALEDNSYEEKELIKGFFKYITKHTPKLVSFNGRCFDIPVLKYRAMKYGINCKELFCDNAKNYVYRYNTEYNCDLLEVLSDFGSSARIKLNEVCSILGFPGKFGVDGSEVSNLFDKGKIKEIRDYCETDVLNTYLVYLRYNLFIGKITLQSYNDSIKDILDFIDKPDAQKAHLKEFKEAWREASNNEFFLEDPYKI